MGFWGLETSEGLVQAVRSKDFIQGRIVGLVWEAMGFGFRAKGLRGLQFHAAEADTTAFQCKLLLKQEESRSPSNESGEE